MIKLQPTTIVGVGSYVPKTVLTNDDIRDKRPADFTLLQSCTLDEALALCETFDGAG